MRMVSAPQEWRKGADNLLLRISENSEDVIDEVCASTWHLGEEDWWENAGDGGPERQIHSERTYAYVVRSLAHLLTAASDAAIKRASEIHLGRGQQHPEEAE